ncbi:SprT family zinc-dependent metalloprotease [Neobacillus sp. YIM B06451]|uniref:M48 family metallopeptidase n=1 Tax=Neobacillus sp. YIM B06451 TaxID=3070994 RepID=UPI00292CAA9F|nr:SprT family zinc-dependent metalloprotease [Neobacillus sp. YIM B06451]
MLFIRFGNQEIPYTLTRSNRRKTLGISVGQYGVSVVSPPNVPFDKIESTLYKKAGWIVRQLTDLDEMKTAVQVRRFVSGEKLPYLGRNYRLKVIKADTYTSSFRFYQGQFLAELPKEISVQNHREVLLPLYINWIKERALLYTRERIKRFTIKLQAEPIGITIKDQEQRWGSCTPAGNILLNWRIFLAPASAIDYVLAHELVHLKIMNHSKEYWETLRMLLPDYEKRKEWLRMNGGTLDI